MKGDMTKGSDTSKVALVDGMAKFRHLKSLTGSTIICSHLANHFLSRIQEKYNDVNKERIIFDRHDVPHSLKYGYS